MKTGLPVKAGWRNGSIKYFLKKMDEGSKDTGTGYLQLPLTSDTNPRLNQCDLHK
jgi:hypothetical protein